MCRAMNRSFTNVLFGAFGTVQKTAAIGEQKAWKQETVEGAAQLLEQASLVVVIPGYGMAVAQAQHKVRSEEHTSELQSPCNLVCRLLLEKKKKKNTKAQPQEQTTQRQRVDIRGLEAVATHCKRY